MILHTASESLFVVETLREYAHTFDELIPESYNMQDVTDDPKFRAQAKRMLKQ